MTTFDILATLAILAGAVFAVRYVRFFRVIVNEGSAGILLKRGRFERVLEPGHYIFMWRSSFVRWIEVNEQRHSIPGQEVMTADRVAPKISLVVRFRVRDPQLALLSVDDYTAALHLAAQLALRQATCSVTVDELLERRLELGARLTEDVRERANEFGLEVISVDAKDVMLPGDVKRSYHKLITVRQEGQAAIEKARSDAAVLRSQANSARMIAQNPTLLKLKTLDSIDRASEGVGNSVVFKLGSSLDTVDNERESS